MDFYFRFLSSVPLKIQVMVHFIYCDNCLILTMIAVNEEEKTDQYSDKQENNKNRPLTLRVKVLIRNLLP